MVTAMMLLLGTQADMFAQKRGVQDQRRPGMEMQFDRRPGKPMDKKAICQRDIERLQDFYWKKYRVKLTKKEAERILIEDMKNKGPREFARHTPPPPKKGHRPEPRGPQRPHKK